MPITIEEKPNARKTTTAENPRWSTEYVIRGTANDLVAKLLAESQTPMLSPEGLPRTVIDVRQINFETFEALVEYSAQRGEPKEREVGERELNFEIGGENGKITHSLGTTIYAAGTVEVLGGDPVPDTPDFSGAIGVSKDKIEGVDIDFPSFIFSERFVIPLSRFNSAAYMFDLYRVRQAPVNNAKFRVFEAGEVKFLGATGSQRGNDDAVMTFRFAASPNLTNLTIGDITGIAKLGWEYLWVYYEPAEDDNVSALTQRPRGVYVEQVFRTSDFGLLGIGVD